MGRLVDRWGPRRMLLAVTVLLGLACMALIQRKFVVIHKAQGSGIAEEAIKRIATLYGIEKEVRGQPPDKRVKARQRKSKPISNDLEAWLHAQLTRCGPHLTYGTPTIASPGFSAGEAPAGDAVHRQGRSTHREAGRGDSWGGFARSPAAVRDACDGPASRRIARLTGELAKPS
jgi:hypothetical protein